MKHLRKFESFENIQSYKDILLKNGYTDNGSWFKKETQDNIHYAWIWKSSDSMKMVGYKKEDGKEYGERIYFVSPDDKMNFDILQDLINNNVK